MGIRQTLKTWAEAPKIRQYGKKLASLRGTYGEWLSGEKEEGRDLCRDAAGTREDVIRVMATHFSMDTETLILYGDEDATDGQGGYHLPWFRPDWSPELLESCFYLGSLVAVRRSFLEAQAPDWKRLYGSFELCLESGEGLAVILCNENPDEAYRAFVFRLCQRAGGWERGCRTIAHLPAILHHCSLPEGFPERRRRPVTETVGRKKISVIIPSKDNPSLLAGCLSALRDAARAAFEEGALREEFGEGGKPGGALEEGKPGAAFEEGVPGAAQEERKTGGASEEGKPGAALEEGAPGAAQEERKTGSALKDGVLEIIVVDNGSSRENRDVIAKIPGIQYLYEPMEFDFSRMCNLGAKKASGEILLFLNDDVELLPESGLERMAGLADREGVGCVGLKLLYPHSAKIQHAGITNLPMGPVHKLQFLEDTESYYHGMNRGLRNVLAVTAACLMIRADRFWEAGGFDETLKVAFNDVALGFRLYEMGYRNVCVCDAHAYHHESLTRGGDDSMEKLDRLLRERERLYELFPDLRGRDPYYAKHLGRQGLDVRVRPGYVTMKNAPQEVKRPGRRKIAGYREDPCLLFRVEDERRGEMIGYMAVLGDDNACYERLLLLKSDSGEIYAEKVGEQYRPDLEENLKDQVHVALCGFWIRLAKDALPPGSYQIGAAAKRMAGRVRLCTWSNRFLRIEGSLPHEQRE